MACVRDERRRVLACFSAPSLLVILSRRHGRGQYGCDLVPIALISLREGCWRRGIIVAATAVVACVAYKLAFILIGPEPTAVATRSIDIAGRVQQLLPHIGEAWKWLVFPLSGSIIHADQLRAWLGPDNMTFQIMITLVLAICHGWFWWQAWRGRQNLASFVAIGLMLLFYGLVAAILVGRVSTQGAGYLMQQRYTFAYQWNIVALLMMILAQYAQRVPGHPVTTDDDDGRCGECPRSFL